MIFKFRYIILLLPILCCSCVSLNKKGVDLYCNDFDVKFVNNDFGEMLFFDDLKKSILSKLRILAKKEKQNVIDKRICVMKIDVSRSNFMSIINSTGDVGQEDIKVGVRYELNSPEVAIAGYVDTFYGSSMSGYPYSDYTKNKKNKQDEIEILSEDIFMDIVKQLN